MKTSSSIMILGWMLLILYVAPTESTNWWRRPLSSGQYCPHYPITAQLKRRNALYGRCSINFGVRNTCRNSRANCCENSRGDMVCVMTAEHDHIQRMRLLRSRLSRLFRTLPSRGFSSVFRDDGIVTSTTTTTAAPVAVNSPPATRGKAIPNNAACPTPKITCADGHCARECSAYSSDYTVCTNTGICPPGRICCDDPCYGAPGGRDVGRPHLKLCYPGPISQPATLNDRSKAVREDQRCPSLTQTCNRLGCDPRMCPTYDASYTDCSSTDDCAGIDVCCSDPCSTTMKCHPPKGLQVRRMNEARANQLDMGDSRDGTEVCPKADLKSCIHWSPIPGRYGTGTCEKDSDCSSERLCCKITECYDDVRHCVPKFELAKKSHPDCPVPHYTNQSFDRSLKRCRAGKCPSGEICCDADMQGTRACFSV